MNINFRFYRLFLSFICLVFFGAQSYLVVAQDGQPTDTLSSEGVDIRLKEIVQMVDENISKANQTGLRGQSLLSETELSAKTKIVAVDNIKVAAFSKQPSQIRDAIIELQKLEAAESKPAINRISEMYAAYADALDRSVDSAGQQNIFVDFQSDGSWFENYLGLSMSAHLHAENNERQFALQTAQVALNVIPEKVDAYTLYAKTDITSTIAQLHNVQGNINLAIEASLAYLHLTEDKPDAKAAIDLINNLIYSHGVNRDHEALIFLSEKLLELEKSQTSDVRGLSEYRVAQAMNMAGQFEQGLEFSKLAKEKSDKSFLATKAQVLQAVALAGLGQKSESRGLAKEIGLDISATYLLKTETRRDQLYLGFLLAQGENNDLALKLYNRQLDVTSQKLLSASARDTTSMLASLENSRERQAERAAAAKREAALLEMTIQKQRKLNRMLMVLVGLLALASISLLAFLRFRERTMRALAIKTKEAASADKLKTEFLGLISHELRTPLNGIIGFSDLLSRQHTDPDVRKKTSVILQSGHELLSVVEAMTDMARIDAGRMDLVPENTEIPALLAGLAEEQEPKALAKGLEFTAYIDPELGEYHLDGSRLRQSVETLLSNAISFTKDGRVHMHVTSEKDESGAVNGLSVIVADTGLGMTDLVQSRLFTPFMQADTSMKRGHMGTGLSLAIAQALTRLMGGEVTVVSRPGRGSEFTLKIPLIPAKVEAQDVTSFEDVEVPVSSTEADPIAAQALQAPVLDLMQPRAGRDRAPLHAAPDRSQKKSDNSELEGLRVLIVDDLKNNREVVRLMLETEGCICFEAPDGEDALTALHTGPIDAVIMDIHMTHMDGVEATRLIRECRAPFAGLPIIALTADAAAATNAACMAAGADIFLTKPVLASELFGALRFLQSGQSARTLSRVQKAEAG